MIIFLDKYAQLKYFHHYCQIQVYMYHFIYVDTETITAEDQCTATIVFVLIQKNSTPEPVPKHCLGFSYIHSADYE